ncbi:MAG: HAMP domain-containing protein [Kiritimatiellae bacterium]|nr:HAMP domain-containing protein [Kiritimatiellia bacterium]
MMSLLVYTFPKRMLRPFQKLAKTAHRISRGQLKERIQVEHHDDEIGMLAQCLNTAFDQYQKLADRMKQFGSDASHQLRTPLSGLRTTGEICLQKERSPEEHEETIAHMLEETQRLTHIVEQLLILSRLDETARTLDFKEISLNKVIDNIVEQYKLLCEDKKITLHTERSFSVTLKGDELLLNQVFANLLDNAIRFTPEHGTISISTHNKNPGHVVCSISDTGPGIPPAFRDKIFERFSQLPQSHNEGAGLGLAIVADIIKLHGGTIRVLENPHGGANIE